jgi:hypothetical protein
MRNSLIQIVTVSCLVALIIAIGGCAGHREVRVMDTTAYCGCGKCCSWERGSWKYLKFDVWNKYVSKGTNAGKEYTGHTASGTMPHIPHPGVFSYDSIEHPWMIPFRMVLFPLAVFTELWDNCSRYQVLPLRNQDVRARIRVGDS